MAKDEWEKVETAPTWDFREDKELIGFYVGAESEVGPNKSNLYTFRLENGEIIAVWGNTVLDVRFKNLIAGEKIKIVYKGKVKSPRTGREYNDFEVYRSKKEIPTVEDDINPKDIPF